MAFVISSAAVARRKAAELQRRNLAAGISTVAGCPPGTIQIEGRCVSPANQRLTAVPGRSGAVAPRGASLVLDTGRGIARSSGVPAPPPRTEGFLGDLGGFLGDVGCSLLPPGARQLCEKGVDVIPGLGGGKNGKDRPAGPGPCPEGTFRIGDRCVDPSAAFPGGDPFVTTAGGSAVQGSFGMPAIQPAVEQRTRRTCPAGMVLGKDNLCYPRQILSRRSNFRKWKAPKRPPLSVRDANAIRRAERAKARVKSLAKDVGFSVKKR